MGGGKVAETPVAGEAGKDADPQRRKQPSYVVYFSREIKLPNQRDIGGRCVIRFAGADNMAEQRLRGQVAAIGAATGEARSAYGDDMA